MTISSFSTNNLRTHMWRGCAIKCTRKDVFATAFPVEANTKIVPAESLDLQLRLSRDSAPRVLRLGASEVTRGCNSVGLSTSARAMTLRWDKPHCRATDLAVIAIDRKSTRLNSSHLGISY